MTVEELLKFLGLCVLFRVGDLAFLSSCLLWERKYIKIALSQPSDAFMRN